MGVNNERVHILFITPEGFSVFRRRNIVVSLENSRKVLFAFKSDYGRDSANGNVGLNKKLFGAKHALQKQKCCKAVAGVLFYYA